jgi:hypothetical protein
MGHGLPVDRASRLRVRLIHSGDGDDGDGSAAVLRLAGWLAGAASSGPRQACWKGDVAAVAAAWQACCCRATVNARSG